METIVKKNPAFSLYYISNLIDAFSTKPETGDINKNISKDPLNNFRICLAAIQLSNYDSFYFVMCSTIILELIDSIPPTEKNILKYVLPKVENNLFSRSRRRNEADMHLRTLYLKMDMIDECLANCEKATSNFESNDRTYYNCHAYYCAGQCYSIKKDYLKTLTYLQKAIELDPSYKSA
jgi:tetratricopeptide (TPR) repeat protein